MGRVRLVWMMLTVCLFLCGYTESVKAAEYEIEQVQENMPEVRIYLRSEDKPDPDILTFTLGTEVLTANEAVQGAELEEPIDYFVLVDVSNSIPDSYCESIKKALISFSKELNEKDRLILLTFGEEVKTLLSGDETSEQREEMINRLHNTDRQTLLFEAIFQTADMADSLRNDNRKIVLVISDGEDFAIGASTGDEAVSALRNRNMPVYAMGIKDTKKENLNQFGETARLLGGTLTIFDSEEAETALKELQELWKSTWLVKAYAKSNQVDYRMNRLSVEDTITGYSRSKEVLLEKYQKDTVPPHIIEVEKAGERQLLVHFSEEIEGAENSAAWNIECDGVGIQVLTAVYENDRTTVLLTFENDLYAGNYCVKAPGITDISMEKNTAVEEMEVMLEGVEGEIETGFLEKWWWLPVAAILLLVLIPLLIWRNVKKNKGVVYIEGKAALVSNVEKKQHISVVNGKGLPIVLEFIGDNGLQKVETTINRSLIVGRSSACEVSLEDGKMSRQHFVLEYQDGSVYITDLNTTNGTAVNGVTLKGKHKLNSRDVITAGSIQMRITW